MAECAAVVLAAGMSSRMGAENKLLLDWHGVPLIAHVMRAYVAVFGPRVTVVTGYDADHVTAALADCPVTICHNAAYETGQPSSVLVGLTQTPAAGTTVLGLADQPLLTADDLRWLISEHQARDSEKITIPWRDGARGNPIVIPPGLRSRILQAPRNAGCRRLTRDHPELVTLAETSAPGFFRDMDTPEEYAALRARTGGGCETVS